MFIVAVGDGEDEVEAEVPGQRLTMSERPSWKE